MDPLFRGHAGSVDVGHAGYINEKDLGKIDVHNDMRQERQKAEESGTVNNRMEHCLV